MRSTLVATVVVAAAVGCWQGSPARAEDPTVVRKKFDAFCAEWIAKLSERERNNKARIRWQVGPDGVVGEYIGYSTEHECKLVENGDPNAIPVGKITYREMKYRQSGKSTADAAKSTPRIVELTEVTEIFRYASGRWVY